MASTITHMCVANELNKKLNRDKNQLLLGSIAPDISKLVGETKVKSHFLSNINDDIPNIKEFLNKYSNKLDNDFILGYYIHLYTDKLWFGNFIDKLVGLNCVKLLDGTILNLKKSEICKLIYNDYSNLNIQLLDQYNMDLSLFYNEPIYPNVTMNEIDINKLNLLLDKAGIIIKNSEKGTLYTFDIYAVNEFIKECTSIIYDEIIKLNITK